MSKSLSEYNYLCLNYDGLTALTDHMKVTREKADANVSAIRDLGEDLAGFSEEVVLELNKKQPKLTFDSTPTVGSTNPVTSGGVAKYVNDALGGINSILDEINGEVV